MVIDYSKWDNLELSDDSDIEVHPNVDKKSFIRWKQRDIHEKRSVRQQEKDHLESEQVMNDRLLKRIEKLLTDMKMHSPVSKDESPDEFVLSSLLESASPQDDEKAPFASKDAPTYGEMMTKLADKVASEVPKDTSSRWDSYVVGLQEHYAQLLNANKAAKDKLEQMVKEDSRKITSDGLRMGFDSTHIAKPTPEPPAPVPEEKKKKTSTQKNKVQQVEVLNPQAIRKIGAKDGSQSSGDQADIDETEDDDDDEEDMQATQLGKDFAQIKAGDYMKSAEFISKNPTVLVERETDGLLVEAFNSQLQGKAEYARQCVHQALLLQYCRQLGRDGVALFFKRVTTPGHQAQKVFFDDVNSTYNRIRSRTKEIAAERAADNIAGVEQIQLHAVDPNTQITIGIPRENSDDPEEQEGRKIYESFPPGLRRALESGVLDEVNKVLGKMSVEEAEEVVRLLSEGGMLSLEEQIIDATTEEGQAKLAEIEKSELDAKQRGKEKELVVEGVSHDPLD